MLLAELLEGIPQSIDEVKAITFPLPTTGDGLLKQQLKSASHTVFVPIVSVEVLRKLLRINSDTYSSLSGRRCCCSQKTHCCLVQSKDRFPSSLSWWETLPARTIRSLTHSSNRTSSQRRSASSAKSMRGAQRVSAAIHSALFPPEGNQAPPQTQRSLAGGWATASQKWCTAWRISWGLAHGMSPPMMSQPPPEQQPRTAAAKVEQSEASSKRSVTGSSRESLRCSSKFPHRQPTKPTSASGRPATCATRRCATTSTLNCGTKTSSLVLSKPSWAFRCARSPPAAAAQRPWHPRSNLRPSSCRSCPQTRSQSSAT